jgi:superfamily II DNA or RNA helicase
MSSSLKLPPLRYREKFRDYQRRAIDMVRRYRIRFQKNGSSSGASLVYHPTGTGKTAVIAGLAHGAPEIGNVLILSTREAIRDQLARELSGNLFIDSEKFNLGGRIRLAESTYVVAESQMLKVSTTKLHEDTRKLFTAELDDFATTQFARLIDSPADRFVNELSRRRSIVIMSSPNFCTIP